MSIIHNVDDQRKRPVSLTIRGDLLDEAKSLDLNASAAAERGIEVAVREARARHWLAASRAAIEAHNARVSAQGTLLTPPWSEH